MIRHGLKKTVKFGIVAGAIGGTGLLLKHNDWEVSTIGVARFGRAALAAVRVVIDYKTSLYGLNPEDLPYKQIKSQVHTRSALRLREMCCKNGGAFIKVGQHLGSLEYLLPTEYIEVLKVLHDKAPESPLTELFKVVEEDLGKKIEELFTSFEPKPLGAASLAQVHKATLKDGRTVAVKIQHPKVKAHSFVDIKTMTFLVSAVAYIFPDFQYKWLAEETKRNLPLELDFLHEGKNCERIARVLKDFDFLKVPEIYWNLSSERVLTMEYCEGGKVDDRQYMKQHGIPVQEVTKKLGILYSEMIFVQGYVHCDPHPGNVLVNKKPHGVEIVLLDHGIYQSLTDEFRLNYCKLWMSLIKADVDGIKKYAEAMNAGHLSGLFACMLTARSWDSVTKGIDKSQVSESEADVIRQNAAQYIFEISDILNRIPRQMLLILKTNDVIRGIESSLKTPANAVSFINMSKCCTKAVARHRLKHCHSWFGRLKIVSGEQWQLFKINLYECYLWITSSKIFQLYSRCLAVS
ncbi:aarF domain-containing protein kinase 1 [Patella vulgata]|uniref:aarF domain-containing protein kinase 1 n=1 Tax=Patella vulgata TaxID=6465 RepID=UPI00217FF2DD|nr:aarF domain-containing protein kinase 1 [Patella vulgata]